MNVSMNLPAPLWRRLMSALYDGLLLLGLWFAAALIDLLVRDQWLGIARHWGWMQAFFFAVGLAFFGGSWTRGGQTLGMRVWRVQVRRLDGAALRWPLATLRYAAMLATWMAVLAPTLLLIPRLAQEASIQSLALACLLLSLVSGVMMLAEARRRAICDWIAGTEVVELPKV